jgi:hypothetical protein
MLDTEEHDLLVRIDERVCSLTKHFGNHIKHHWMLTIPLIMTVVGLIIVLLRK